VKILVADDDLDLLGLVAYSLSQSGYLVVKASDGPGALSTFDAESPDLVILDINMPGASGFEVCTAIRARGDVPVMMLTARGEEQDLVRALELGADDYLTKPFSPRTLLARVRALLRRSAEGGERPAPLATGDFILDVDRQAVSVGGREPSRLTKLEFRLLQLLFANAGHTLPAERLLRHVWGNRASDDRQLLKQLVHRLRLKIEPDVTDPRYLVTVSGIGYTLRPTGEEPPY
jgi:DNA-binding response OmpR family regulator